MNKEKELASIQKFIDDELNEANSDALWGQYRAAEELLDWLKRVQADAMKHDKKKYDEKIKQAQLQKTQIFHVLHQRSMGEEFDPKNEESVEKFLATMALGEKVRSTIREARLNEDYEKQVLGYLERRGISAHFKNGTCYLHNGPDMEKAKKAFTDSREQNRLRFKTPTMKIFEASEDESSSIRQRQYDKMKDDYEKKYPKKKKSKKGNLTLHRSYNSKGEPVYCHVPEEKTWAVYDEDEKDFVSSPYTDKKDAEKQMKKLTGAHLKLKLFHKGAKTYETDKTGHKNKLSKIKEALRPEYKHLGDKATFYMKPPKTVWKDGKEVALADLNKKSIAAKPALKREEVELDEANLMHDIHKRIAMYKSMGFRVEDQKVGEKAGEFTVIDKEGNARRHVFDGNKRRVENLGNMRPSDEEGGEQVKKKRGRPKKDKFA